MEAQLDRHPLSREAKGGILVEPVPRNVHPVYNERRIIARSKRISPHTADALFVDAAKYGREDR